MNLNKEILRLSLPAIVSNITVPLLGLSDTAISGHLGRPEFIAAIAVASMMLNVAFWLFGFLRMGTTGLTAEAFGASDNRRILSVLMRSVLIALTVGVLFVILRRPMAEILLDFVGAERGVRELASEYYLLCIFGAPALLSTMSFNGWFVGMQSTFTAMIVSISVNVINIALSLLFVFVFDMGFIGVGWGTLIAQWIGLLIAAVLFVRFLRRHDIHVGEGNLLRGGFAKFFRVNTNLFFRSACVMMVSMSVTAAGARLGSVTLAANAVMMQFFVFFSYFMDGFAFTGEALTGRFSGAGDYVMLRRSVRQLLVWSAGMALSFFLIYFFGLHAITSFITDDALVIDEVMRYKFWVVLIPVLTVAAFIFDGFFIGLTRTGVMLLFTALAGVIFFVAGDFSIGFSDSRGLIFHTSPDNNRLWGGFLAYLLFRGVSLAAALPIYLKKLNTERK